MGYCTSDTFTWGRRAIVMQLYIRMLWFVQVKWCRNGQSCGCRNFALDNCTTWQDGPEMRPLAMGSLSHYDVVKWVVKPSSERKECSFVELVANEIQPAEFYVTHYFGQPVRDMLECLQHQLRIRQLGDDTLFWIWAYAHQPSHSFVPDSLHSSDAFKVTSLDQ